jgi:predicted PurR-regulated permease PerM
MAREVAQPGSQKTFTLILLVVAVAALYFAADVLIPLALAVLLTFTLAPLVARLERLRVPRVPAVLLSVGAAFVVLFTIGWIVAGQMVNLASELPTYQKNIAQRIQDIRAGLLPSGTGPFSKVKESIKKLGGEIVEPLDGDAAADLEGVKGQDETKTSPDATKANAPPKPPQSPPAEDEPKPVLVEVVTPSFSPYSVLGDLLPGALGWLGTAGIVVVFVIFMLLEREDMRNRLIRLIGPDQITVTTQALDDAGRRVSRYLRMQLIINASYGLMLALGLYFIGLPNAVTWGLFAGLLRYLPYVGPWVGAAIGILLSFAFFENWTGPVLTIGLFVTAELFVNNVLEPVLYQSSTGISTIGILAAALFWTWLWGPLGLVLSTPLTVCIAVMGRYVPNLEFLNIMLTDEQVLPPGAHYYQRLLVSDEEESRELVEEYLRDHSPDELFENVLLPALALTEQDAHRGTLDETRREYILENVRDLLEELPEMLPRPAAEEVDQPPRAGGAVIIVPARDLADEVAGLMLQLRLRDRRIEATVLPIKMLFGEILEQITQAKSPMVVISAVPPFAVRHARHLLKRLRHRLDGTRLLAVVWGESKHENRIHARLRTAGADRVVGTLEQAQEFIERQRPAPSKSEAPPADVITGRGVA